MDSLTPDLSSLVAYGGHPAVTVVLGLFLCYVLSAVLAWYRLRHIPGPFLASFSYLWLYLTTKSGKMHLKLVEEHRKHGKIVRIGPNDLAIYDPSYLYQTNSVRSDYVRSPWYAGIKFDPYGDSVLSELDTARHDKRKALVAGAYAGRGVVNLEQKVDSELAILVDVLKRNYTKKGGLQILDFSTISGYFQADIITLTGSGEALGDVATETDRLGFLSFADSYVPFLHSVIMVPLLRNFFFSKFFLALAGPKPTHANSVGRFLGHIKNQVAKRFDDSPKGDFNDGAMLDEWVKNGMSRRECELEFSIQMVAGIDTSTTALRAIMLYTLTTPNVYAKLRDEITDGIREGRISKPITNEEAKKLPYLQAVIHEGLRMVPPVIMGFPKRVPAGGDTIGGQFVPGGTDMYMDAWGVVRNKEIFGEDADLFRPERFLEGDETKRSKLVKSVDLIFGYGRWQCLGKNLAWMELNKIFVELFREFEFQVVNPGSPWQFQGFITPFISNLLLQIRERPSELSLSG
ncbi:cytochrome P450 [Camillea tinctor]|nr:cytochrome P450 [Camillea tinctor]